MGSRAIRQGNRTKTSVSVQRRRRRLLFSECGFRGREALFGRLAEGFARDQTDATANAEIEHDPMAAVAEDLGVGTEFLVVAAGPATEDGVAGVAFPAYEIRREREPGLSTSSRSPLAL